jgi:hypothetical protein
LTVLVALAAVVAHEGLVGEQGGQRLCLVVFQATTPHAIIQLEQRLEPFAEWLRRLPSPTVGYSSLPASQVPLAQSRRRCDSSRGFATFFCVSTPVNRIIPYARVNRESRTECLRRTD